MHPSWGSSEDDRFGCGPSLGQRQRLTSIVIWDLRGLYISASIEHRHDERVVVAQEWHFRKRPSETGPGSRQPTDAVKASSSVFRSARNVFLRSTFCQRRKAFATNILAVQQLTQRHLCDSLLRLPFCLCFPSRTSLVSLSLPKQRLHQTTPAPERPSALQQRPSGKESLA